MSLVFGGSHLAVTTVLSVFMAGLALGSYCIGRNIDNRRHLLRTFGLLELGVGAAALLFVGLTAIALQRLITRSGAADLPPPEPVPAECPPAAPEKLLSFRLILWGVGLSGFCAMGYEVLWNRILSIAIGASAYGFTLLLMAFLSGIGLGSATYGLLGRIYARVRQEVFPLGRAITAFGTVQVAIGVTALLATVQFPYLPVSG